MTTPLDSFDVTPLLMDQLVANTPLFLFRRFSAAAEVRGLGRSHNSSTLVDAYNELAARPIGDGRDEIRAYVALVGLSFATDVLTPTIAEKVQTTRLPWARELLAAAVAQQRNVDAAQIAIGQPLLAPLISSGASPGANATFTSATQVGEAQTFGKIQSSAQQEPDSKSEGMKP